MTRRRKSMIIPGALLALLVAVPSLAGCSVQDAVNQAVEGATGGNVSVNGELPKDWPTEVPVVDGRVLVSAGGKDGAPWVVTIDADGAAPVDEAKTQLQAAGFVAIPDAVAPSGAVSFTAMTNGTYSVVVAGTADGLVYTLTRTAK